MWPPRRHVAAGLAVVALVLAGVALSPATALDRVRSLVFSPWFPLVLAGLYVVRPLLAWPITALSVVVGYRYGIVLGVPVALGGAVATSLLPYAAARYFRGGDRFGWAAGGSERFFEATGGLRGVIAVRLAPAPAEPVSLAAGLGRVPAPAFVLGTAVGELPWTVAAVLLGGSMRRLSLADASPDPLLVAGGLLAAGLLLAGPAYRYARSRAAARPVRGRDRNSR